MPMKQYLSDKLKSEIKSFIDDNGLIGSILILGFIIGGLILTFC